MRGSIEVRSRWSTTRAPTSLLALTLVLVALLAAPAAHADPVSLSSHPISASSAWESYVLDQGDGLVYPKHVYVAGAASQVHNPAGLMQPGGGGTTITSSTPGDVQLVLDLGIDAGGYVEIGITRNSGARVRLGYSEARRFLTPDGDTGLPVNSVGVPFVTDPSLGDDDDPGGRYDDFTGTGNLRSAGIRGAERWISIELETPGSVSIDYVRVRQEHLHPTTSDYVGHFLSSDPLLNRIWYAGVYTFTLVSFKDLRPGHNTGNVVVTDGAKRDRLAWLGDLVIENMLGDYSLRQAPQIVKDTIQLFSCQQFADGEFPPDSQIAGTCPDTPPTPTSVGYDQIPEYTAWWVTAVHDYDLYTGDDEFARRMLPDVVRALGYFTSHIDSNGLYSTPPDSTNWHPFDVADGEDAHTNTVIYRALLDGADLERRLGERVTADSYEQQAAALRKAILADLWDPSAGAFLLNSSDQMRNHTEDAQVEPVLDGVVTGRQALSALGFVERNLSTTYGVANGQYNDDPYMSNYISPYIGSTDLLARLSQYQTTSALDLMRREWGHMVNTDPNTTLWEKMAFDGDAASYSPNQAGAGTVPDNTPAGRGLTSLAHGWAGGPIPALSGYILGVRPQTAGFGAWIVEPQPGDLSWAQGQVPTPHGPIASRWQVGTSSSSFKLTVAPPSGTSGTVAVPLLGAPRVIAEDGRVVWNGSAPVAGVHASSDGTYVHFAGVTGTHTWAW
jgi:hypothetical protein